MLNILVVYYYKHEYPARVATADHLYSFRRYSRDNCFYWNAAFGSVPRYVTNVEFDLIIFQTIFLSERWDRDAFRLLTNKIAVLKENKAVKVALPQDEFINTDLLSDFINEFDISHVFSVAPESEWNKIYVGVDQKRVKFTNVLTGYLDESTVKKIEALASSGRPRTIDIGYRAWRAAAWLGRHGILKVEIADRFNERAPAKSLVTDISTNPKDTFLGDAWYEFLLRCKYMIGVEGGASVLDRDGTIREKTDAYVQANPQASFEEIEARCFPGLDGELQLFAISPRHLEACATRTCQVLIEGWYNGVLEPGRHYIELKRDFSNLESVLDDIKQDHHRIAITERAYQDVVASGNYTYRSFVETVIHQSLPEISESKSRDRERSHASMLRWAQLVEKLSWVAVMLNWNVSLPFRSKVILPAKKHIRERLVRTFSEKTVSVFISRLRRESKT
jgi:hypothetical protein